MHYLDLTRLHTWAVLNTFAEIHSTYPGSLMGLLEFPVFDASHITQTRDLPISNLSYDCDLITVDFVGFPFALVFTCTFTESITYITKYMSSTGIIRNFGRLRDVL